MYRILLSGHKPTFELYSFDPSPTPASSGSKLEKISDSPAPPSTTWLERHPHLENVVYGSSETENNVYQMMIEGGKVEVKSERYSGVKWPVHLLITRDGKSLITGGLGSGETVSIPLKTDGSLSKEPIALTTYPEEWPYSNDMGAKAKFPTRQNGPHVHGVTTDSGGRVFVFDLGSDATWIAERSLGKEEGKLRIVGRMERSRGDTPRHGIISDDDKHLYVNSELQSELLIYSIPNHKLLSRTDITPPHLPSHKLLSAEIYIHPIHRSTLYISNRGSRRLNRENPELGFGPEPGAGEGDTITIILLSPESEIEEIIYVQTGLDWIRGMRISDDGMYLAGAGEVDGGLEVYQIGGGSGEVLDLVAKDEGVKDVNCVLWV